MRFGLPDGPEDMHTVFAERSVYWSSDIQLKTTLVDLYNGVIPRDFEDYFPPEQHVHVVNTTRVAWDDLANITGKEMPIYCQPENNKQTARNKAEKRERIAYGWNAAGRLGGSIGMERLMKIAAWWLVGTADFAMVVSPDFKRKTPYFSFRDPRTHYPPPGYSPWMPGDLDGTMFAYQVTLAELKMRYPDSADLLDRYYAKTTSGSLNTRMRPYAQMGMSAASPHDLRQIWIGEFYHSDAWYVATLEDRSVPLVVSEQGVDRGHPGLTPVVQGTLYNPDWIKGRSIFADQISLQPALSRMFSQKLDFFDKTLYPIYFTTPLSHPSIRFGPNAINVWEPLAGVQPNAMQFSPTNPVDSDEMMGFVVNLSRMLNRNPESFQGAGPAESAKALNELKSGVMSTVMDGFWPTFIEALPKIYSKAARMDMHYWGDLRKAARGSRKNTPFIESYVPNKDLAGYEDFFEIETGIGLGGYQQKMELMQMLGAEMIDELTAMEQMPGIRDPEQTMRRVQQMRMEKLLWATLNKKAEMGEVDMAALAELRRKVMDSDENLFDAVSELAKQGVTLEQPAPAADPMMEMLQAASGGERLALPPGAGPQALPPVAALRGR